MNEFLARYKELGEEFDPEEIHIPKAIRINTLKTTAKEVLARLKDEGVALSKIPFLDWGYTVDDSHFSVGAATEHLLGYYYMQETAAQIPVQVLHPLKNETVLDMSAAPGGKTTQMAQYMENEGVIVALDTNQGRLLSLRNNIERMGVTNTILYQKDGRFAADLGVMFDKILLDAPCSGNFCIDAQWFDKRSIADFKVSAKTQKSLLVSAIDALNKGGELVYSTCSLEPEEDELVVDWVLREFPEVKLLPIDIPLGDNGFTEVFGTKLHPSVKLTKRFWPHKTKTQGFFIARFKKH